MRNNAAGVLAAMAGLLLFGAAPIAPTAPKPAAAVSGAPGAGATTSAGAAHTLDAADVNAWLDGYMPYALKSGDIAGAVVVVVKDGQVLTERGYGVSDVKTQAPVDPKLTLFRPGSISKLFTWTSVMQLVQAGKLNLDADVNGYLDFKIPPYRGRPVTLRELMTHSAGFEEAVKGLFALDAKHMLPLDTYIKRWVPARIYPPAEEVAYSNYGAALAGYIVERVSGESFDDYVAHHIFQPLGMAHSTFDQPLPKALAPDMSKGYRQASIAPPIPFEFIAGSPAGALSSTGEDMAKFMIAHLENGGPILNPATAQLMHAPQFTPIPHLNGMALGFYHEDRNGHVIVGHAGDTEAFHSDLHLFLNDGVGLFISMNSLGARGAAEGVRTELLAQFADRYFPAPPAPTPATWPAAKADAHAMAGYYISNRRSDTDFLRLASLASRAKVTANKDGTLTVSAMKTVGGAVKTWREIGPFYWQEVGGTSHLAARVANGKVLGFASDDLPPVLQFEPAPAWTNPIPLLVSLGLMVLLALQWPITAVVRRRYGGAFALVGARAWGWRAVRIGAWVEIAVFVAWMALLTGLEQNLALVNDPINPWLRALQILSLVGVLAVLAALWNLWLVWTDKARGVFAKLASLLWAAAFVVLAWYILALHLFSTSLNF